MKMKSYRGSMFLRAVRNFVSRAIWETNSTSAPASLTSDGRMSNPAMLVWTMAMSAVADPVITSYVVISRLDLSTPTPLVEFP